MIDGSVAKKRSQRAVKIEPALLSFLEPIKESLKSDEYLMTVSKFRKNQSAFLKAAGIDKWKHNALRHSFGSYHFAHFQNANLTASEMGSSEYVMHQHYKSLVSMQDAASFWAIRYQ